MVAFRGGLTLWPRKLVLKPTALAMLTDGIDRPLLIGSIYQVEKRLREERAGPLERQRTRWLESRQLYEHLIKLTQRLQRRRRIVPRSKLGQALSYAVGIGCWFRGRIPEKEFH